MKRLTNLAKCRPSILSNFALILIAGLLPLASAQEDEGGTTTEEVKANVVHPQNADYWAFRPVERPDVPKAKGAPWGTHPIDGFILARLRKAGLEPAARASRQVLIRRAYYDLTGLPPTPEEVAAFVADYSANAYEKLIDRLLESPHYGEKWGRHWLDVVRYAETNGYERDSDKPYMWRYRDYVINAFNNDIPFTQFVMEQLAGDEMENAGPEQITATGFYRLGLWDDEPSDKAQGRYDVLDDILSTTSQAFLGLSVGCARCHEHKIDPIPQEDYYRLLSFFQNITNMSLRNITSSILLPDEQAEYDRKLATKKEDERRISATLLRKTQDFTMALTVAEAKERDGALPESDISNLRYRFYRGGWSSLPDFDEKEPEAEGDVSSNFLSTDFAARQSGYGLVFEGELNVPEDGEYIFRVRSKGGSRLLLDGKVVDASYMRGESSRTAAIRLSQGVTPIRFEYFNGRGEPVLEATWSGPDFENRPLSLAQSNYSDKEDEGGLRRKVRKRSRDLLGKEWLDEFKAIEDELKEARERELGGKWAASVQERGATAPVTHVLLRGNPHAPGEEVQPAFLSILGDDPPRIPTQPPDAKTSGRRTVFAKWIASDDNPLTPRVIVNRIWQHHFGRGIVESTNDFGNLGVPPTHPDLLNWLAAEFIEQGWKLKSLHRIIMNTEAYKMDSAPREDAYAKDPANRLFWRFNMRRLTAEEVRDSLLVLAGTMNYRVGGPSVFPRMPREALETSSRPDEVWGKSSEEDQTRRSVYTKVKRSLLTPILQDFDVADTDSSCAVRFVSTLPSQALGMLNSKFVNEQALALAERLRRETGPASEDRVARALSLAMNRAPTEDEVTQGLSFLDQMMGEHGKTPDEALERFCLLALNLNEFLFLD